MSTAKSSSLSPVFIREIQKKFGDRAKVNERLAPYLAYKIGGPADLLILPTDEEELCWISEVAADNKIPVTIVGTGTNLLVLDEGIRGITISLLKAFQHIQIKSQTEKTVIVECGAGVSKPDFLNWSIQNGMGGLEFSSGVPGTIGGGIFMNAGTKYGTYGNILRKLRLFDFDTGPRDVDGTKDMFGYREQKIVSQKTLVVSATFELYWDDPIKVRQEVDRIIQERAEKQPLDFPSCGSTFKNPEGHSAGRLIEKSGLKGTRIGGAEISLKHANFILNKKDATAHDILCLIQLTQRTVEEKFGVKLEKEVIVLGGEHASGKVPNYRRVL